MPEDLGWSAVVWTSLFQIYGAGLPSLLMVMHSTNQMHSLTMFLDERLTVESRQTWWLRATVNLPGDDILTTMIHPLGHL